MLGTQYQCTKALLTFNQANQIRGKSAVATAFITISEHYFEDNFL